MLSVWVKNMYLVVFTGVIAVCLWACGSSAGSANAAVQSEALRQLVEQGSFRIESDWAQPLVTNSLSQLGDAGLLPMGSTAGRINLIGNQNFLEIRGDSVEAYLPYYGERQMGGGYSNRGGGIEFDGLAEDMEITKNDKTNGYRLVFDISEKAETYRVRADLSPNLKTVLSISSSQRHPIEYLGRLKPLEKE